MGPEDLINLPGSSSSGSEAENDGVHDSCSGRLPGDESLPNSGIGEDGENGSISGTVNIENEDNQNLPDSGLDEDMDISSPSSQGFVELTESVAVKEVVASLGSEMHAGNLCTSTVQGNGLSNHREDESFASSQEIKGTVLSGAKRPRTIVDKQQPSVRVIFNSLTRESRAKLEDLLQQWSRWHAHHCSSSDDSYEMLESGEEIYYPALHVGVDKTSTVSFWMDNQSQNASSKEFIPLDGNSVPLYNRGFSLALTSSDGSSSLERGFEVLGDSRCFNCGSYSHSLKDCPKPRDNVAVNNARKQHMSRKNQNSGSRNPTRYYQSSPKGKFDGLRPGVLDGETRRLLGIGELDPPPWLNRMREIGYPPGYLDPEDEDQPSGITIFADEESKEETEEGEILEAELPSHDLPKKMSVEFPGINAPIPENADRRQWEAGSSSSYLSRNHSHRRYDHYSESINRGHYYEHKRLRDYQEDGPPGCDLRSSPSLSIYSHRYASYDSGHNTRSPRSPSFGRSLSEREDRLTHYDYSYHGV